jgi:amidase
VLLAAPGDQVPLHPECAAAARDAARLLESLGHRVEEAHPAALDDVESAMASVTVISAWTARDLAHWSARTGRAIGADDVEPMIWGIAEMGRGISAVEYIRAVETLHAWARRVVGWWSEGFDLLLTPTLPEPPPPLGEFDAKPGDPLRGFARGGGFVTFTLPFNVTGQPAVSLPLHWSASGLPVGVQLAAAYGREDVLIRIAAQLEQARPWKDRRPAVHA